MTIPRIRNWLINEELAWYLVSESKNSEWDSGQISSLSIPDSPKPDKIVNEFPEHPIIPEHFFDATELP